MRLVDEEHPQDGGMTALGDSKMLSRLAATRGGAGKRTVPVRSRGNGTERDASTRTFEDPESSLDESTARSATWRTSMALAPPAVSASGGISTENRCCLVSSGPLPERNSRLGSFLLAERISPRASASAERDVREEFESESGVALRSSDCRPSRRAAKSEAPAPPDQFEQVQSSARWRGFGPRATSRRARIRLPGVSGIFPSATGGNRRAVRPKSRLIVPSFARASPRRDGLRRGRGRTASAVQPHGRDSRVSARRARRWRVRGRCEEVRAEASGERG